MDISFSDLMDKSNTTIETIKKKQKEPITTTTRNVGFLVILALGMMLLGSMILQIVSGILSLFLILGASVGLFYSIRFLKVSDPLIKQKIRNIVLKKMIEEARENNTVQLDNMVISSAQRLKLARDSRDKMGGYVQKLKSKLDKADKNTSNYTTKVQMVDKVENAYELICSNVDKAAKANKLFEQKVSEYKDMAEFTDIVSEAMGFAAETTGSKLEELLGLEAFSSIESDFNEAMVSIENSVMDYKIDNED